ncbi:MAG: phenylalanine 4-monooxygenase [Verrucomicrobia bacterium]|nr:phenylalanine 4-monooxygenase [Verrucomicrobiota bacterium]
MTLATLPTRSEAPAAAGADPRCVPVKLAAPIAIGDEIAYPGYTDGQHDVWRTLFRRQEKLLPGRAADEFLSGLQTLGLDREKVPALAGVSRRLQRATDWRLARAPGLLDAGDFFSHLARRVFPCTDYVRGRDELDYTPAPDCFHDIFGHTPMIVHPRFADFYQKIGQAAVNCHDPAVMEGLVRIYWFTVEFGLVRSAQGLRIYGNGIISSAGETLHCFDPAVTRRPFVPEHAAAQPYDIWHFQDTLFVIESFDRLEAEFERWATERALL